MRRLFQQISFRVTNGDRQRIELAAWAMGVTVSEFARICTAEAAKTVVQKLHEGQEFTPNPQPPELPKIPVASVPDSDVEWAAKKLQQTIQSYRQNRSL